MIPMHVGRQAQAQLCRAVLAGGSGAPVLCCWDAPMLQQLSEPCRGPQKLSFRSACVFTLQLCDTRRLTAQTVLRHRSTDIRAEVGATMDRLARKYMCVEKMCSGSKLFMVSPTSALMSVDLWRRTVCAVNLPTCAPLSPMSVFALAACNFAHLQFSD